MLLFSHLRKVGLLLYGGHRGELLNLILERGRRNDLEITAEILRAALNGAKKTHIVHKANLNYKILHEYLNILKKSGLIINKPGIIKTTEKGLEYLKHYDGFVKYVLTCK